MSTFSISKERYDKIAYNALNRFALGANKHELAAMVYQLAPAIVAAANGIKSEYKDVTELGIVPPESRLFIAKVLISTQIMAENGEKPTDEDRANVTKAVNMLNPKKQV